MDSTPETISARSIQEYPLTRAQAALWFLHRANGASVAYNLAGALAVPGDTDLEALRRAFQALAARHPMLRTLFAARHGEPVQRVYPSLKVAFRRRDASTWSARQLDDHLAGAIYRPFSLGDGPTWRVNVFEQAPVSARTPGDGAARDHLILMTLHHIIGDLWSMALILSEVMALYDQEVTGTPARLKSLHATYADHVQRESERLRGADAEFSWQHWRDVLSGELPTLSLPTDRARPAVGSGRGAAQSLLLDMQLTERLRAVAKQQHASLHGLLLAAFQVMLYRHTGQDGFLVGFPKAGRSLSTARIVGYFVNQTVVRADLTGDPRFTDLLDKTQGSLDAGSGHDWYPFSSLVRRLQHARDLGATPLIQAVFSWQQAPRLNLDARAGALALGQTARTIRSGELAWRTVVLSQRAAPFDLTVLASETAGGLGVTLEYATDLFVEATIARMAARYHVLLESIAADPEQRLSELDLLPERERRRLLDIWNDTTAPYPEGETLQQLFERQVERTPQATAAAGQGEQLTYSQLNLQANQLAHCLRKQGVGPDRLVGICLEPSVQMIVAIMGILKAGGAYLPLDPSLPEKRLAFMLADARPVLVCTRQGLRPLLAAFDGPVLCLDVDQEHLHLQPHNNPIQLSTPDHLAYVIYTSGSTGQPKGAALAHRGVVNLLIDFQRWQAIRPGEACSWWTSPGFDVSVYEIFSPLIAGGSLYVIPEHLRLDAPRLLDWLHAHHICSAYLPPFLLEDLAVWVSTHPGDSPLRRLLVGVEPIPEALLSGLRVHLPALCILNGYGPTETTICSTLYPVPATDPHPGNTPIGRPVANTELYLLDRSLQPVPVGVVGELYIGGVGLARGYVNRPQLTAERFVPSPFRPGERLYRTGDLARYLADGNLVFVGRTDTQIKLHGVRIELGEIEATLVQHPAVKQAAVVLQGSASGGKRLVAYATPSQGEHPSPKELRQYLAQRLMRAIVPATVVVVDALPLTTSGKVNRRALPPPQDAPVRERNADQAARTNAEQALASIWEHVLGIEHVGIDDSFFELGGDSIMSLQIVARAREAGLQIRIQDVFQAPTIAALAARAGTAGRAPTHLVQGACDSAIPLTPIQHWFFEQEFPDPDHWNLSLLLTTRQPLDPLHLGPAVSSLLVHHEALRLRYSQGPAGWQQTCGDLPEEVPFEVVDLSHLSEAEQADAIEMQTAIQQRSLDLSEGLLMRAVYFLLGAGRPGRLLLVVHHLAVDGVSWRILLEDLLDTYRQHERGMPITLAAATPFTAWARHLSEWSRSLEGQEEANYWLRRAWADLPPLPVDLPLPDGGLERLNTEATAQSVTVSLNREETQALLREMPTAYGSTVNAVLLTGLARAVQRWTHSNTLWIDLEAHGRQDPWDRVDLSRTVGWCTVVFPVCLKLPGDAETSRAVSTIQDQLDGVPQQGVSHGLLRYLYPDPALRKRLGEIPPAPIGFNYLGQAVEGELSETYPDLVLEPLGHQRSPEARRPHLIEIDAAVLRGELRIRWTYCSRFHLRRTIERVAGLYVGELRTLIAERPSRHVPEFPAGLIGAASSEAALDAIDRVAASGAAFDRRKVESVYPLSPMQQGMVFQTLYAPGPGAYVVQTACTVQGRLDRVAFANAWQQVTNRHSIMRTAFAWQGLDRALQVVRRDVTARIRFEDWRDLSAIEQQKRLDELLASQRREGFDLSVPPLCSLSILRTGEDTSDVVLCHHHAVLDGWSVPLIFRELLGFYDAYSWQESLTLPSARPYRDYITWLRGRDVSAAEAFWRRELEGLRPVAWPGSAHPSHPPATASRPAAEAEQLSDRTTAALQALSRQLHLTVNTLIQGAWAIALSRVSQREDVCYGVVVAGRPSDLRGVEHMVGTFINTLPLRVRIAPSTPCAEWLHEIQDRAIEMQRYAYSPLAALQAWSGAPHRSPLFRTLLVFENYPTGTTIAGWSGNLEVRNVRSIEQSPYPLTIAVMPGQQIGLHALYDPALLAPETIRDVVSLLRQAIEDLVANPGQALSALPLLAQPQHEPVPAWGTAGTGSRPGSPFTAPLRELPLEHAAGDAAVQGRRPVPPSRPLEQHLVQLYEQLLKMDGLGVDDGFFELGGDSLTAAICIHRLQGALCETIPLAAIFEAPTASELASYLEQNHPAGVAHLLGTPGTRPRAAEKALRPAVVVPIQRKGDRPPLFCIHPAGGVVFPYYTLVPHMRQDQPLYGLQDPDLYDTLTTVDSIEAMAAGYVEQVRTIQDKGPYHLLGWSVGGVVAYEMAQQLFRQGESVGLLVMLDTRAPAPSGTLLAQLPVADRPRRRPIWIRGPTVTIEGFGLAAASIASYVRSGLFLVAASAGRRGRRSGSRPTIADLLAWAGFDTWRTRLLREAHVAETVSRDASLLLVEMPAVRRILELVRVHRRLGRRYSPKRYPGRIVLFRGVRSSTNGRMREDPTMGWGVYAEGGVEVHVVQANHVALLAKPYVGTVARELTVCLDRHRHSTTAPTGGDPKGRGTINAQAHRPESIS